tara:strand:- start:424 stop:954 length:531 start_codon:yes stop_codon:yes gene_type:complete
MITIGIDPGKSGGIVFINGDKIIEMYKCPNTIEEMAELLEPYRLKWDSNINVTAYIEQVHAFPSDGRSSVFKFGTNYGIWQGLLGANKIETKFIAPQVWMRSLELPKSKVDRKRKIKSIAQKVIDKQGLLKKKVTLNTSDAVLIGMYGVITTAVSKLNLKQKIDFLNKRVKGRDNG